LHRPNLPSNGKDYQIKVDCNVEDCRTNALLGRMGVPNVNRNGNGIVNVNRNRNGNVNFNRNRNAVANANTNGFGGRDRGQNRKGKDYGDEQISTGNLFKNGNRANNGNIGNNPEAVDVDWDGTIRIGGETVL